MRKSERKIKKYEIILCILVLAVVAAGLLLPKTGELVLLDELCSISVIWIVCIYVVVRVIQNWKTGEKSTRTAGVIIAAVCAVYEGSCCRSGVRHEDGHADGHRSK